MILYVLNNKFNLIFAIVLIIILEISIKIVIMLTNDRKMITLI